jgi:hypothetical protein
MAEEKLPDKLRADVPNAGIQRTAWYGLTRVLEPDVVFLIFHHEGAKAQIIS